MNTIERKKVKISDLCIEIVDCLNRTAPVVNFPTPYKMIRTSNIKNGVIDLQNVKYVSEETYNKWTRRSKPQKWDILLTREAPLWEVWILKDCSKVFLWQRIVGYRIDWEKADNKFIFYSMLFSEVQSQIRWLWMWSTVEHMRVWDTKELVISLPPLPTQQRIASILSNYDDLIENNTRRIQILEEQAQALYRHRFVDFKFPWHEQVKIIDSGTEFGMIPEGWEVKSLWELVLNFDNKRKPLSSKVRQGFQWVYPYYGAAKIIDYVDGYLFDWKYLLFAEDWSVITEKWKPVLQYVNEKFWVSNHAHILQWKLISTDYLYIALSNIDIAPFITWVAQPKINQANLNQIQLLLAQKDILESFDLIVSHLVEETFFLKKQNINLKKQRDLLLPRLMSGEILVD